LVIRPLQSAQEFPAHETPQHFFDQQGDRMSNGPGRIGAAALMILFGWMGSMVAGLLFFGNRIFVPGFTSFQFVAFGLLLSLLIVIVKRSGGRNYLLWAALLIPLLPIATHAMQKFMIHTILRDLITGLCLALCVLGGSRLQVPDGMKLKPLMDILVWTIAVVVAYLAAGGLLLVIHLPRSVAWYFALQARLGLLIGLGVSVGIAGAELAAGRAKRG
jgi:hypothetical protein